MRIAQIALTGAHTMATAVPPRADLLAPGGNTSSTTISPASRRWRWVADRVGGAAHAPAASVSTTSTESSIVHRRRDIGVIVSRRRILAGGAVRYWTLGLSRSLLRPCIGEGQLRTSSSVRGRAWGVSARTFADFLLFGITSAELVLLARLTPTFTLVDWIYVSQHLLVLGIALTRG